MEVFELVMEEGKARTNNISLLPSWMALIGKNRGEYFHVDAGSGGHALIVLTVVRTE